MGIKHDWILTQINMLIAFIARVFFDKDTVHYEVADAAAPTQDDILFLTLTALINERKICEAEDLLFENLDGYGRQRLAVACEFYQRLNALSDEELEGAGFSREEINEGLVAVMKRYGLEAL